MRIVALAFGLVLGSVWAGFADEGPAATTTTLATSHEGAFTTRPPVFTATVETASSTPVTGRVEFVADGVSLGQASVFTRDGHRVAVMGGATLAVGTHTITAHYDGDPSHLPSESGPLSQWMSQGDYLVTDLTNDLLFYPFWSVQNSTATAVSDAGHVGGFVSIRDGSGGLAATLGFVHDDYSDFSFCNLGGRWTNATAVNDAGHVVGGTTVPGGSSHAFLCGTGGATDLGTLEGGTSQALAINGAGQVVGNSSTISGTHAFRYAAGTMADLGTLGGPNSAALAIDSSGSAAGYADLPSGERHAAYYASSWRDLGTLGGTLSEALAMNDAGQVAGFSTLAGDHDAHAFLWQDGQITDLAGPDGPPTAAVSMNDAGQVVGWTTAPGGGAPTLDTPAPRNGFLYSGTLNVLGTLHGGTSQALDVSNAGLVVGVSDGRAFVSNGGPLRDLGTLGGPGSAARAINDQGLIAGQADVNASGMHHAVAWRPEPVYALTVSPPFPVPVPGATVQLAARLTVSGLSASGERIDFTLDGVPVGSATTNGGGASVTVSLAGFGPGSYPGAIRATHAASFSLATADLVVADVHHAPVAASDSYDLAGPLSVPAPGVLANDSDADGDALSTVLVSGPAHGTVTLAADGSFTYTPEPSAVPGGLRGDEFTYQVVAAGLSSNVARVSLVGFVQPVSGGLVSGAPVTIDDSPGVKIRPRVSGGLLTYPITYTQTDSVYEIHYYDFATGFNGIVPHAPGEQDDHPEIDRGRIAFQRRGLLTNGQRALIFDVATSQLTPISPGSNQWAGGTTIGSDTVAYTDAGHSLVTNTADNSIGAWNLPTATATRLGEFDYSHHTVPQVSPAGDLIVWFSCQRDCRLYEARRTGDGWTTSVFADAPGMQYPDLDTDGTWIVHTTELASSPGFTRIHLRSVADPSEDRVLDVPGAQMRPSIDGGVISFDGGSTLLGDIFVYVIATNTLYQVTNTRAVNETASDVSVLPNGDIRVTWLGGFSGNAVRALTFTPGH